MPPGPSLSSTRLPVAPRRGDTGVVITKRETGRTRKLEREAILAPGGLGSLFGGCEHFLDNGGNVIVGRSMVHNAGAERELASQSSRSTDTHALGE